MSGYILSQSFVAPLEELSHKNLLPWKTNWNVHWCLRDWSAPLRCLNKVGLWLFFWWNGAIMWPTECTARLRLLIAWQYTHLATWWYRPINVIKESFIYNISTVHKVLVCWHNLKRERRDTKKLVWYWCFYLIDFFFEEYKHDNTNVSTCCPRNSLTNTDKTCT